MVKAVKEFEADAKEVQETKDILLKEPEAPKRVKIIIAEGEGEENQGDVFVSVNGKAWQIKRGFEVEVPQEVIEVLDHAVTTKMTQNLDTQEMYYKNVPRFAYQIVR